MKASINYEFIIPKDKESEIISYLKEIRKIAYCGTLLKQEFNIEDQESILSKFKDSNLSVVRAYITSMFRNLQPKDMSLYSVITVSEKLQIECTILDRETRTFYENKIRYKLSKDVSSLESLFSITFGTVRKRSWLNNYYVSISLYR